MESQVVALRGPVPSEVVLPPQLDAGAGDIGDEDVLGILFVVDIGELVEVVEDVAPDGGGLLPDMGLLPLLLVIEKEGPVLARVEAVHQEHQQVGVELEGARELGEYLPHAVDELQKYGRLLVGFVVRVSMTTPLSEFVSE